MRHALLAIWMLALTACGTDRLSGAHSELRATPEVLRWENSFIGFPTERSFQLENRGRAGRTVEISLEGPFTVESRVVELPAGAVLKLAVRFAATAPGHVTRTLTLTSEDATIAIGLEGDAFAAPECGTAGPCHRVTFDPSSGACVDTLLPEGTDCSAPCLDVGSCHGGQCLGTTPTCDDGNACTQDSCNPEQGCIHIDASASCALPPNPCKVPYCDPQSGCGITDAADGTLCGTADCVSADICLDGQCKTVPVPEGATCAPQSPCQIQGICQQQQCVRPEPTPLRPVWTYTADPSKTFLLFTGVADAQGNVYWAECLPGACELVSFTRGGLERYRVPLRREIRGGAFMRGTVMLVGSSVMVASNDTVQSFRASDGVEEWFHNFRAELLPNAPSSSWLQMGPIVDLGGGRIAVRAVRFETDPEIDPRYESAVVALSTSKGNIDWMWRASGYAEGLVAQADGTVWFYDYPVSGSYPRLIALTRAGAIKFSPFLGGRPLATFGDRIVLGSGGIVSTLDAIQVGDTGRYGFADQFGLEAVSPLLGNGIAFTIGESWGPPGTDVVGPGVYVRRLDPANGNELWAQRLDQMGPPSSAYGTATSQAALLDDNGLMVARGDVARNPWQLLRITKEGTNTWACELPFPGRYAGAVIANGRWTALSISDGLARSYSVSSFDVPGAELAPQGWSLLGGSPEGAGRPR